MKIEDVYRELAPKLQSYLIGNGCSYATACDILQETFLRLWKRRDELSDDLHQVSGLAFAVARNYRNDLARKARHETLGVETSVGEGEADDQTPEGAGGARESARPGEAAEESSALKRRLKTTLGRMPVQLLETFALSRLGKLSVRDVASGTGTSEANVKVRVHRAREQFMALFRSEDGLREDVSTSEDFTCAVLKAMMMLAAVDGEIDKEELALYREIAEKFRKGRAETFGELWEKSVRAMSYIGFLSEMLSPEELVREYVHEAAAAFSAGASVTPERIRTILSTLKRMAAADGDYSRIERDCVSALAKHLD